MNTTLKLTTWDRLNLTAIVGKQNGDARFMRKAHKILDAIEMNDTEREAINFRQLRDDNGQPVVDDEGRSIFAWDKNDEEWTVELKDPDAGALLKQIVQEHKWTAAEHSRVIPLFDRLGID